MRERERPQDLPVVVVWVLVAANALIWIALAGSFRDGAAWAGSAYAAMVMDSGAFLRGEVWRPFTALWLHQPGTLWHVGMNLLLLVWFGRGVEREIGRRRFSLLYLIAGLACTLSIVPWSALVDRPLVGLGASGAVYGVMAYAAVRHPRAPIALFGVIRIPLALFVGGLLVASDLLRIASSALDGSGAAGHIAGALAGAALAWWRGHAWSLPSVRRAPTEQREGAPVPDQRSEDRLRVDALLEKIHAGGMESLSAAEQDFLKRASARLRRDRGSVEP